MTVWSTVFIIGVIIQMAAETSWVQIAVGRLIAGAGVGALSIMVPMYVSETGPRQVRGSLVSTYQLFITLGIFTADCINYGTEARPNSGSWRIPMGIGFIWPLVLGLGILVFPESPRYAYRNGRVDEARAAMAKMYGVHGTHREVRRELAEIKEKHDFELSRGKRPWIELITGPRMAYRTMLGIVLQALQQLTGANFFFYYGTTIFEATGLSNSFVTAMILGGVNFGMTFFGLYVVEKYGRRKSLIVGGIGMTVTFLVFASVGGFSLNYQMPMNTPKQGTVMIVFACLFIAFYAVTWGPIIWCIVGERKCPFSINSVFTNSPSLRIENFNLHMHRLNIIPSISKSVSSTINGTGHLLQLDLEFPHRILHSIHHQRHPIQIWIRLCRLQFCCRPHRILLCL